MATAAQKEVVLAAVKKASEDWKAAFNSGNSAGCAAQYESDAVMKASPFGTFNGTEEIRGFWEKLIGDGFADVEYVNPKVEVVDSKSAVLSAGWKMNKAGGTIHKELWVVQADGSARLRIDEFEATG